MVWKNWLKDSTPSIMKKSSNEAHNFNNKAHNDKEAHQELQVAPNPATGI
jgi:hypothetical protein